MKRSLPRLLSWNEIKARANNHSVTRQNTHSANERIHVHKGRNLGFVVHEHPLLETDFGPRPSRSDAGPTLRSKMTRMRHSDERRTTCALPFKTAPLNEPADLSIRHCYSM